MKYSLTLKPKSEKDLKRMMQNDRSRVVVRLRDLQNDLSGDAKKLTNFDPEYRMHSGNWRVLLQVEGDEIIVYRIAQRKDSYR